MNVREAAVPKLRIELFGRPRIVHGDVALEPHVPRQAFSLLAAIALNGDRPSDRSSLAYMLWPDETEDVARGNVRRYLYRITHQMLPTDAMTPWLVTTARTVKLNPAAPVVVDVREFDRLAALPDLASNAAAVELYADDLLRDFDDAWLEPHRRRYNDRYASLVLSLAERHLHGGTIAEALGYARRLLLRDPLDERALIAVLRVREALGERIGALREYREYAERLHVELGTEPSPDAVTVYKRIVSAVETPAARAAGPASGIVRSTTRFYGRGDEIRDVGHLLTCHPLVTITGVGGMGKTRLAHEVASTLQDCYSDGVVLVDLTGLTEESMVPSAIATAIGVGELGAVGPAIAEKLIDALRQRRALIVLDNCEHVLTAVGRVVTSLQRCGAIARVLATSREPLRAPGEMIFELQPLGTRDGEALFLDRYRARASHATASAPAQLASEIAREVDGIPLAIEIAAASLTVDREGRADRNDRSYVPAFRKPVPSDDRRHETMTRVLNWSFERLDRSQRAIFRRLSCFAGGFTLEAAAAVCGDDAIAPWLVYRDVVALAERSLITAADVVPGKRYRMFAPVRAYGRARAREAGEVDATMRRAVAYYTTFGEQIGASLRAGVPRTKIDEAVAPELDTVRAALGWSLRDGNDVLAAGKLVNALRSAWPGLREGLAWTREALAHPQLQSDPLILAGVLTTDAFLSLVLQEGIHAMDAAERAICILRGVDERADLAVALLVSGSAGTMLRGDTTCEAKLREAYGLLCKFGMLRLAVNALDKIALGAMYRGDYSAARDGFRDAIALCETFDSGATPYMLLCNLATVEASAGDLDAALAYVADSITGKRRLGQAVGLAVALRDRAIYLALAQRFEQAEAAAREAIEAALAVEHEIAAVQSMQVLVAASVARGDEARAVPLLGFIRRQFDANDYIREVPEQRLFEIVRSAVEERVAPPELERMLQRGRAWNIETALDRALHRESTTNARTS